MHVAAGVLENARGEILVARRFDHAHQGGLWEFPGGKLEAGEEVRAGLARELAEELGIIVDAARPLIRVRHDYPDRHVLLDVWRIAAWHGRIHGREGQELKWLTAEALPGLPMPAADVPIVRAVRLPDRYLITPSPGADTDGFLAALSASVESWPCSPLGHHGCVAPAARACSSMGARSCWRRGAPTAFTWTARA
jgi:8-oxo-dGTP diphosphatase